MSVEEIIEKLESEIARAKRSQSIDAKLLSLLFLPTGAIQETAIDNGWGNESLELSQVIDLFVDTKWINVIV